MQLSKDEFAVLSELLDEGLDLPEASRGAWLEGLSEPFVGSKALLREMLVQEASGDAQDFLVTLPKFAAAEDGAPDPQPAGLKPGARLGSYLLIREIGQGGMSTVWLARRTDQLTNRPVALKLPHLHLQTARFAARFARERDILANLTHPHIAHLYDAGISAEGQPFLAMEFVAGDPLTQHCMANTLGVDNRLQLFLQVLEAVDYAHTQNVIHRDLKPSNILVREDGQVVLLDFGIAKLMVDGQSEQTELTLHGGAALTPHYASPEQIRGDTLGPATDIYSLGVLLYELLSGQSPYELAGSTRRALEAAILSTEPRPPSEVVTQRPGTEAGSVPESLRNRLRGDLDTIVLKALKKSPTERYPTAGALAEDLRRYVRGDAVSARPDTFWYRLTKRTHRHRSALQGAAVAGLAVAAVAVITNLHDRWMPNRHAPADSAIPARRAPASPATMINAKSVAVLPFLDMSAQKDQQYFADGLTEEMIDLLTKIRDLRVPARTSSFYFKDKQATIAEIARTLGVANLLEGSVRKSGDKLRITAQLIRADSGYHLWSETYDRQLDDVFKVQDEIAGAVVTALKVSLMSGSALESTSSQNSEAYNLYLQGRFIRHRANSKAEYDLCLDYLRRAVQADPTFAAAWAELSIAVSAEAEDGFAPLDSTTAEARHAAQRALALDPALPDAHTATARILIYDGYDINGGEQQISQALALDPNSSWALSWAGELATYRGHFDQAIELRNKALFNDPVNNFRYSDLAYTLYYAGRYAEARGAIRKMLDLNPGAREDRWIAEYALLASGDAAGTLAELDREPDEQLRRGCGCRALALDALGRTGDANAALAYLEKNQTINGAYPIGRVYASRGNLDRAFEWFSRAYRQRDDNLSFAKVDPLLKNVQSDPRFNALLRKIGLLDLHDTAPSSNGS